MQLLEWIVGIAIGMFMPFVPLLIAAGFYGVVLVAVALLLAGAKNRDPGNLRLGLATIGFVALMVAANITYYAVKHPEAGVPAGRLVASDTPTPSVLVYGANDMLDAARLLARGRMSQAYVANPGRRGGVSEARAIQFRGAQCRQMAARPRHTKAEFKALFRCVDRGGPNSPPFFPPAEYVLVNSTWKGLGGQSFEVIRVDSYGKSLMAECELVRTPAPRFTYFIDFGFHRTEAAVRAAFERCEQQALDSLQSGAGYPANT